MFTIEQIKDAHVKVKSGADFPRYIYELKALGVSGYQTFVADGHTEFRSADGNLITSEAKYAQIAVAGSSNSKMLQNALTIHQAGGSDFQAFCQQAADAGVEKWEVNMEAMTCVYYDRATNVMVTERIPQ